jgi:hypothetical protein
MPAFAYIFILSYHKTYTMLGEDGNEGIIGRAVRKLFDAKREIEDLSRGDSSVALSVELLEVYNEQIFDLLGSGGGSVGKATPLKIASKEVIGNAIVPTESSDDVMKVLALAQSRRCVKATASNKESSRSHMIFTIHFKTTLHDGSVRSGKLNVCDLAGSERLNKSGTLEVGVSAHGQRVGALVGSMISHILHFFPLLSQGALLKETKNINTSLMHLSTVIERLQAGDQNPPYRQSKLTLLLQDSLGGNSKTLAIICCSPLTEHFNESLGSLKFAQKVNKVDLKAFSNYKP